MHSARAASRSRSTSRAVGLGTVEGRVEARERRHDPHPVVLKVRCLVSWLDVPPQLVGQKPLLRLSTYWDIRMRAVPIWIDEEVWLERWELGDLASTNWLHFSIELPPDLPRALEGTFVSFAGASPPAASAGSDTTPPRCPCFYSSRGRFRSSVWRRVHSEQAAARVEGRGGARRVRRTVLRILRGASRGGHAAPRRDARAGAPRRGAG